MTDGQRLHRDSVFTYDLAPGEPLSQGVLAAVSNVSGAALVATDDDGPALEPLYETIDPDALDAMFVATGPESRGRRGHVSFTYQGHRVTASSDRRILVSRAPASADETAD